MKTSRMMGIAGAIFSLALVAAGTADFQAGPPKTAENLYQEALLKIDGEGDLAGAIKIFQRILSDFSQNRSVAGKAQFQIGMCYEKLGRAEAEKAYQEVIKKFADQADLVQRAKERLALFAKAGSTPQNIGDKLVLREVDIPEGEPSPDGKTIVYTNLSKGLFLHDIATGQKRTLKAFQEEQKWLDNPKWSPDGEQIAYLLGGTSIGGTLLTIRKDGLNDKKLYSNHEKDVWSIVGWSPDQKGLYVVLATKAEHESFGYVSTEDGSLREFGPKGIRVDFPVVSPDGRFIAYEDFDRGERNADIHCVSTETGQETVLIQAPSSDYPLGWTANGRYLTFISDRSGNNGIWIVSISEGKAIGEPVMIKSFTGSLWPLGVTKGGSLYFSEYHHRVNAYTAELDLEKLTVTKPPSKIETSILGQTTLPFWSPGGKELAYLFRMNQGRGPFNFNILRIRSIETGKTRDLVLDFEPSIYSQLPRWSADGNSIYLEGDRAPKNGLFRIDVRSGSSELFLDQKELSAWTDDGKRIVYGLFEWAPKMSERKERLIYKNRETGEETVLFDGKPGEMASGIEFSPDGEWISFRFRDFGGESKTPEFRIIPLKPGHAPIAFSMSGKDQQGDWQSTQYFWTFHGDSLLVGRLYPNGEERAKRTTHYWLYKLSDPAHPVKLDFTTPGPMNNISFRPDEKTIAGSIIEPGKDIRWVMENYIPKELK